MAWILLLLGIVSILGSLAVIVAELRSRPPAEDADLDSITVRYRSGLVADEISRSRRIR